MSTITSFDLDRFTRAAEERDADTQLSMYAPDATVTIVDKVHRPGSPQVLTGHAEIRTWLEDIAGRDMTHSARPKVSDGHAAAFVLRCRYPDGAKVLCATLIELSGGLIAGQTVVQAWDEN